MANSLVEVPAIMVPGQVLEGVITPPSLGVNDFDLRLVPGAEAVPVGSAPQALTEIVSGGSIPRRYASVDYVVTKHGSRFGVTTAQNSGYNKADAVPNVVYGAAVFVVKHSNVTAGAATIVTAGGWVLTKDGGNWKLQNGSGSVSFPGVPGVEVIVATSNGGNVTVTHSGGTSSFTSTLAAGGAVSFGTAGFVQAANGVTVFDVALYSRALSGDEASTVRSNAVTAWS